MDVSEFLTTGAVCSALGFQISVKKLLELGVTPVARSPIGYYWHPQQVSDICARLARHFEQKALEGYTLE